jgi:predicted DsbA family dithiol-disulfide isomerase
MALEIKVYSDYVCPFCFLAEFPLDEAVRGSKQPVSVEWMPFELRPEPVPTLRPEGDYLQQAWSQSVYPIARRMGIPIQLPPISPQPRSTLAFEGYQFARERGKGLEYNHGVLAAFFQDGRNIGQIDVLTEIAGQAGLDESEFAEALRARKYRESHEQALNASYAAGVTSVPTFVIGDRVLVGLQDRGSLESAIAAAHGQ